MYTTMTKYTKLNLSADLATADDAWIGVGHFVQHVVTHLTVSISSPSLS